MTIDRGGPGSGGAGPGSGGDGSASGGGSGETGAEWGNAVEGLTGRLLVATPALRDPNFERTVVLIVAHEDGGALGVVLNRATEVQVTDVLGNWGTLAGDPAVVFEGGPVQPEAAICLARTRPGIDELNGFTRVSGAVGTVDLSGDPEQLIEGVVGVRVFAGYAGWSPGQLEGEISGGSWFVFDALPSDAFAPRPDDLWQMVLRRQGGLMAAVAHYPADPTMN
jgi:putative transcriptional regulator